MRLMVTGSKGQLGSELIRLGDGHELLAVDVDELDITDAEAVSTIVDAFNPDAIVNAAAFTAVDYAESNQQGAFAVNHVGPQNLAIACEARGIPLIHVSTDYVFDGSKRDAYMESDSPAPLGVYGMSKLAGENAVQQYCSQYVILRTSWVFSRHGNNFVITMLRLGKERESLGIVGDQYGCPTSALELANAIYTVLDAGVTRETTGIYHFCQPEATTWFGFAKAVFAVASTHGMDLKVSNVNSILTTEYPTAAMRPANSVMNCHKFEETFDYTIRPWADSLNGVIEDLNNV